MLAIVGSPEGLGVGLPESGEGIDDQREVHGDGTAEFPQDYSQVSTMSGRQRRVPSIE